ncbi:MAG: LuxR family transcriptional regulator [Streptosporangiaceae bacterium]|nr:LuxR family transcriptional regulator [Streptosporangiaceae bacterium]
MVRGLIWRCPGELPAEVTGFVGRQCELAQLAALLRGARLVTVTGPGGVGKTRVAVRAAALAADRFRDGVCLVELSGLRDPELLPNVVAASLRLPENEVGSQLTAVLSYLRGRQQLVLMDTCEHLVDACAMFAELLLRQAPEVTVLATSRQPMDVPGEHICAIPPLPVPEPDAGEAGDGDAVELFAQRASAVVPDFAITDANRAEVIRLCRRLDGIPLAIELAAVRLRAVPLEQLVWRLEDRFRLLSGNRSSVLPHHQTLHAATMWSYELCRPAEQLLWARLSVFAGSFDLAAAEEVCAGGDLARQEVLPALIGLVDKSVVLRAGKDQARYRLLDTIREFGAGMLAGADSGIEAMLRDRHTGYYLAMADVFDCHAKADDQLDRYRAMRSEHANIRAAIEYAIAAPGRQREAARMAAHLRAYWEISGLLREGRHWVSRVLEHFPGPSAERAWLLMTRGTLATLQGEVAEAIADLEQCVPMAQQHDEPLACALGCAYLCLAFAFAGCHAEAEAMGVEAERRLSALDDFSGLVSLDIHMAYLHMLSGDLDKAVERCSWGLDRLRLGGAGGGLPPRQEGERWARGYLLVISGLALFLRGEHEASFAAAAKALQMKNDLGDTVGIAYCFEMLALLAVAQQRYERAVWVLGAADPLWERAGRRLGGNAILEELHERTVKSAREALGEQRYATLRQAAARHPLSDIVALATADADRPGGGTLTARQLQIAGLVVEGLSNRQIAERLIISKRTVDAHVEHIFARLGVTSRVQIANRLGR